ncbi:uncharacterized lipoprotein YbbD [Arthrobacter sp. Hiyo4]|nr:uncharacterized lipoprotein YbbD [Arthrobacter sp. Hiyo4]
MALFLWTRDSIHKTTLLIAAAAVAALTACTAVPATAPATSGPAPASTPESERPTTAPQSASPSPVPGLLPLGWGPEQRDQDAAAAAVAAMSVEEKAGQVLMPVYAGTDAEAQAATIERLHLAGSIIMGDNIPLDARGQADPAALTAVNARLAQSATADGRPWPGLIGVDQEGGIVARLGAPLTEWPTALSYGAAGNAPLAKDAGRALAAEIASLGFTVDFAPDADVTIGPADPTIGARSMSGNPDAAGALAVAFAQGMQEAGILPALKHFPGHGSVTVDSHQDLPVQPAGIAELEARDWKPFQAAIAAGMPMVMTGHIAVPALEPGVPASLSGPTYAALRGMGFKGVAVTDALNMGAVQQQYPGGSAATAALAAGADLLLMPTEVGQAHAAIVSAVAAGTLPAARLDEAATRVATMMTWRGRVTSPPAGSAPPAQPPAAAPTFRRGSPQPPSRCCPDTAARQSSREASGLPADQRRTGRGLRLPQRRPGSAPGGPAGQPHRLRRAAGWGRHCRGPGRAVAAAGFHCPGEDCAVRPDSGCL